MFMLDAVSGQLLWHACPTNVAGLGFDSTANLKLAKFVNSIPSDVRVLDISNDGFADRMYVGDTGGQMWRFDINNGNAANTLVSGGVIASLGAAAGSGGSSPVGARRFYNAPDVTLLKSLNGLFLNVAIGSGYRGHPLNAEIHDRFYALRDYRPLSAMTQTQYDAVVPTLDGDLFDVTTNVTPTIPTASPGWKLAFSQPSWRGEKVLAEARTFNKVTLFTTFTPISSSATACTVKAGNNALYLVNALDGSPFSDRDGDSTLESEDRVTPLDQHGIAPEAVILFPSPDDPTKCVGKECSPPPVCIVGVEACGVTFGNDPMKTFWMQKDAD
jgi:type IV pilus assembly protein PilY1